MLSLLLQTITPQLLFIYNTIRYHLNKTMWSYLVKKNENVKNGYIINYQIGGTDYTLLTKKDMGPCKISKVIDEKGNNVSEKVIPYFGPNYKLHGEEITPGMLNFESLEIFTLTTSKKFIGNDVLFLPENK